LANLDICNPGGNPERKLPCKPSKNAHFSTIELSWPPDVDSFVCRRKLPSPFRHRKEQARFLDDLLSISICNTLFVKPPYNGSAVLMSLRFSFEGDRLAVQGSATSPRRLGAAHKGPRTQRALASEHLVLDWRLGGLQKMGQQRRRAIQPRRKIPKAHA
jgi:hypothetical protein